MGRCESSERIDGRLCLRRHDSSTGHKLHTTTTEAGKAPTSRSGFTSWGGTATMAGSRGGSAAWGGHMRKILTVVSIIVAVLMSSAAWADEGVDAFGFGVRTLVCFPEMTGINEFLAEHELDPFGNVLPGVGGSVVAARIGDVAVGASTWVLADSSSNAQAETELFVAAGGLELGWQVDRDERSTLDVGAILGGGASLIRVSGYPHPTVSPVNVPPGPSNGLVPEPDRLLGVITLLAQPHVSVTAELFPWLSLEFSVGYALQIAVYQSGDLIGMSGASLVLSGPMISVGASIGVPGT